MPSPKRFTKLHFYIAIGVIITLLVILGVVLTRPSAPIVNNKSGLYPQNGTYTVIDNSDVICTLSLPPTCSGRVILGSGDTERLEARIDRDTKVRYQAKEVQIYPDALKQGVKGTVTFQPNSAVIDTMVIAD